MVDAIEATANIPFEKPRNSLPAVVDLSQRNVTASARTETVRPIAELRFVVRFQHHPHRFLQKLVRPERDPDCPNVLSIFWKVRAPNRCPSIPLEAQGLDDALNPL